MPDRCPDNCPLVPRVEALEEANKNYDRINESVIARLGKIETKNAVQDAHYQSIDRKLDKVIKWQDEQQARLAKVDTIPELTRRVTALEAKPAKRWDSFGDKVLWFLAEAVLIIAALKIGLM